jgi:predicted DsbA family dithiol-disulfide isomerase
MDQVTFYFDPRCPWCWQTSRWARRLVELGEITVAWKAFSLEVVNRPEGTDPAELAATGSPALRTAVLIADRHGNDAVGSFYESLGQRTFNVAPPGDPVVIIKSALEEVGLDPALHDEAVADAATWASVVASTEHVVDRIGKLGVPTIALDGADGPMIFGPVISEVPPDAEAVELWQHTAWLARNDNFSELKRSNRTSPDLALTAWYREQRAGKAKEEADAAGS